MPRAVTVPLLILIGFAWLIAGLVVAALVGTLLLNGLADDDPQRTMLGLASLMLGGAVMLVGVASTAWLLDHRASSAAASAPWTLKRPPAGAPVPNTLRGDAAQRPRTPRVGPASPVPPPPRTVGMAPRPGGSVGTAPRPAGTTGRPAEARPSRAPVPGSQAVATARQAPATTAESQFETTPRSSLRLSAVLAFIAGVLLFGSAGGALTSSWVFPAVLLVGSGMIASGERRRGGVSAPTVGALLAVAPSAVAGAIDVLNEAIGLESALLTMAVLFAAAWVAVAIGVAAGRLLGAARR